MFGVEPGPLAALLFTQLAVSLYGAGLRRPFGSVETVEDLPTWLRRARLQVTIADTVFWCFVVAMWICFVQAFYFWPLLFFAVIFFIAGEVLTHFVRLIPSAYAAGALALSAIIVIFLFG